MSIMMSNIFKQCFKIVFICLFLSIGLCLDLYSQDDEVEVIHIDVEAKKEILDARSTSLDTTIITREQIEATGANNAAEVLKFSSEVVVRDSVNTQVISIRGNRYEQTLILVNGRRQSAAQNLFHDLSQYNVADIERIEIIKGAATTRYGSGASGGVINIITKDRISESYKNFGIEGGIRYGSYNQITADILADFYYGKENQGNFYISGVIETNARNYQVDIDNYSTLLQNNEIFKSSVRLGNSYKFNDEGDILHASFDYFYENKNSPYPNIEESHYQYKTHKYGGDISYEHYSLDVFDMFFHAYTFYQTVENLGETATIHNSFDNFTTEGSFSIKRVDNFGNGIFIFGNHVEITYRNEYCIAGEVTKGTSLDEGSTVNRNTVSIAYLPTLGFFNHENSKVSRLALIPGIRFDAVFDDFNSKEGESLDDVFDKTSYSLGAIYTFDSKRKYLIKGNLATGYRNPTFNELYLFGASSNSDLRNENILVGGDIGFIVKPINMLTIEGSYFCSKYEDYIIYTSDESGNYTPENIDQYVSQGIDVGLSLYIPIDLIRSTVSISGNYTYQFMADGMLYDSNVIFRVPFIPEHTANAVFSYIYEGDWDSIFRGRLNFLINYTSSLETEYRGEAALDGYYTFDITASMTFIEHITVEAGVRNVLDTKYDIALDYPGAGREWYVGVRGKF